MLTIIYSYRNRDLNRLENSFNSLAKQSVKDFEVILVDYGSEPDLAKNAQELCLKYKFLSYIYRFTQYQPWNKSKALNSVIKDLKTEYCFVADIDMIFRSDFIEIAYSLKDPENITYFEVGFLGPEVDLKDLNFADITNYRKSTHEATGLSLFPVTALKQIRGFDEFYHFWGAEDTDVHKRLNVKGYNIDFYNSQTLMFHQWHPSYRSSESKKLTKDFQISGIVQLNHQYLQNDLLKTAIEVNAKGWGETLLKEELQSLEKESVKLILNTEKRKIDNLLFGILPNLGNGILKVRIESLKKDNPRQMLKKSMGKKVPEYYSLKKVNDLILLHLISYYRDLPYTFRIDNNLQSIVFALKITNR